MGHKGSVFKPAVFVGLQPQALRPAQIFFKDGFYGHEILIPPDIGRVYPEP